MPFKIGPQCRAPARLNFSLDPLLALAAEVIFGQFCHFHKFCQDFVPWLIKAGALQWMPEKFCLKNKLHIVVQKP
jgi:hypothetical protein